MAFGPLDDTCASLMTVFLFADQPVRFNQLYRFLKQKGLRISKPTLSSHLKHLVEKQVILRSEVDRQNVTYRFHNERYEGTKEYLKSRAQFKEVIDKSDSEFLSYSISEQVALVHTVLNMRGLFQLKYEMLKIMEPDKEFEYNLWIIFYRDFLEGFKRLLLNSLREHDSQYRREALDALERLLYEYEKAWLGKDYIPKQ
jgi:Fe2+ or Zn2+ uptake regulation protein